MRERRLLDQQIEYYRQRASEYDRTAYGNQLADATARIRSIVERLAPRGAALEIACGTGMWTRQLAVEVSHLSALDSSEEAIAIAKARVGDLPVRFEVADIFRWQPSAALRFDTIFMAFWLSHVPSARWGSFFTSLASWLAPGGRILIVDEHARQYGKERRFDDGAPDAREVVVRTLGDGSVHHIIKAFIEPAEIAARMTALGWTLAVDDETDWVVASATRQRAGRR